MSPKGPISAYRFVDLCGWWTRARLVILSCLLLFPVSPLRADPADLCLSAARQVAVESGVPLSVLLAVTQAETGRTRNGTLRPWPWTINIEGNGHWFESEGDAIGFARDALGQNRTSFDTGCFQINYRWHAGNFPTLEAMFDPVENARYAARFLSGLYRESGNWSVAAGHYHSRTPDLAERYRVHFDRLRQKAMEAGTDQGEPMMLADAVPQMPRQNRYPLLLAGSRGVARLGSLVPLSAGQ